MTIHLRAATPRPSTLDANLRTVEAIVSTGAPTARAGYVERLDLSGADLSRLIGGPVLDGHRAESTRDQLGIIEAAELRSEGLWVRIKFRSTAAAQAVLSDIGDGTLRGLSIGYSVQQWREGQQENRRVRTAVKWTPVEVSVVPIPADAGAHFRNGESSMENETIETTTQPAGNLTRADMNREIRSIGQLAGLTAEWINGQIDAEATPEQARAAAFEEMATRQAQTRTRSARAEIIADHSDPAVIATRAGEALFARSHPEHQLSEPARAHVGLTIPDMARECLRRAGISTSGMATETLVTRALHTTSDFPLILGDAVNRELRRSYQAPVSGARLLARQTTARDFRAKRRAILGEAPELEKVNEGGEFKHGTIDEAAETYAVATFGKIIAISRQALVNDDLGAFTTVPAAMGTAALNFEAAQLVAKIEGNPQMSDGIAVFDADGHGNAKAATTTGGFSMTDAIAADLDVARTAMRRKTGLSGAPIDVAPRYVLAPPELETEMQKALAAIQATSSEDFNPFSTLALVVEPRLTSQTRWYVVADPATVDGLEYAYLEGAPGPQIETRAGFEVDGTQVKVRLDYGCGWVDHRGWYRVGT
ncbi:prohead protease/major capsid protein fusion protein [Rhodovulum strictum]|uniref:Peptidase U35 n=1 Tax=Rhodovulum strictum TaxID=58314 RepID=A0A844BJB5_9RHOB|nr:prohead protease/major capsid protein fusion protein [Rhodovulum strictum]MRH22639.1 peptidase U35 [Rhodovulum strictum]